MPKARWSQNNWTAGFLSELLKARSDLPWRGAGLSYAENAFSDIRGPLVRAPALTYAGDASSFLGGAMFNLTYDQEPHLLLIGPRETQIRRRGLWEWEVVWQGGSEWLTEIDKISVVQSVDVTYLFHPFIPPKTLVRSGPASFSIEEFQFLEPPEQVRPVPVDESGYQKVSKIVPSRLIVRRPALASEISSGQVEVDTIWREEVLPAADGQLKQYASDDYYVVAGLIPSPGWYVIHDRGAQEINLDDPLTYVYTVVNPNDPTTYDLRIPKSKAIDIDDPSTFVKKKWFDMEKTFPTSGVIVQGRLFLASRHIPNRIFGSAPDAYRSFPYGADDDSGIELLVAARSAFSIERLVTDGERILALTSGGGYVLSPGEGGLITPSTYRIAPFISESIDPYNIAHIQDKWFVSTGDDLAIVRRRSSDSWESSGYEERIAYRQKWRTGRAMHVGGMATSGDLLYVVTDEGIARVRVIDDLLIQAVEYINQPVSGVTGMSDGRVVVFFDGSDFRYLAEIEQDVESVGFSLSASFSPATQRNKLTGIGRSNWLIPVQEAGRKDGLTAVAYDEVEGTTQRVWFESYRGEIEARWRDGINYGRVGMGSTGMRAVHFPIVFSQEDAVSIRSVRGVDLHFDVYKCTPFDVYVDGVKQPALYSPIGRNQEWVGAKSGVTSMTVSGDWNQLYGPVVEIRKDDIGAVTIISITAEVVVQSTDEGRRR